MNSKLSIISTGNDVYKSNNFLVYSCFFNASQIVIHAQVSKTQTYQVTVKSLPINVWKSEISHYHSLIFDAFTIALHNSFNSFSSATWLFKHKPTVISLLLSLCIFTSMLILTYIHLTHDNHNDNPFLIYSHYFTSVVFLYYMSILARNYIIVQIYKFSFVCPNSFHTPDAVPHLVRPQYCKCIFSI